MGDKNAMGFISAVAATVCDAWTILINILALANQPETIVAVCCCTCNALASMSSTNPKIDLSVPDTNF